MNYLYLIFFSALFSFIAANIGHDLGRKKAFKEWENDNKKLFGIKSPSKVMAENGKKFAEELEKNIAEAERKQKHGKKEIQK